MTVQTLEQQACIDAERALAMIVTLKAEMCVDLRVSKHDKPTRKCVSLTLMRWTKRKDSLEYADQADQSSAVKTPIWVTSVETYIVPLLRAARAWTFDIFGNRKMRWYLPIELGMKMVCLFSCNDKMSKRQCFDNIYNL